MTHKPVLCYLMFASLSEIMLSLYENSTKLNAYDSSLHLKLKNLKANFERVSKQAFTMFSEDEQKQFFNMINIFETLIKNSADHEKFVSLLAIIEEFQKGELKIIQG